MMVAKKSIPEKKTPTENWKKERGLE